MAWTPQRGDFPLPLQLHIFWEFFFYGLYLTKDEDLDIWFFLKPESVDVTIKVYLIYDDIHKFVLYFDKLCINKSWQRSMNIIDHCIYQKYFMDQRLCAVTSFLLCQGTLELWNIVTIWKFSNGHQRSTSWKIYINSSL